MAFAAVLHVAASAFSQDAGPRAPFRTLFETRSLGHEQLLPFLKSARPEIVQIGNYGAMFHGYADNPRSVGWPMNLPVAGEQACLDFQKNLNAQIHDLGLTVVGHFRLVKVMGDWEKQDGFVEYYNNRWPAALLGPKPHADVRELLARDNQGEPIQLERSSYPQLGLCLSSPHTREMLKRMLKVTVDSGCDGVMTNFDYRYDCTCQHCQKEFKQWLRKNQTAEEIRSRLGVEDLDKHLFSSIPANIPGYPDVATATELDWLARRWGAEHYKQVFDEIFVEYGRSLKSDLLIAQWNHLSHVSLGEERAFTPLEMWAKDESYLWYSGGAAFVGKNMNLSERKAGDAWLSSLYVREMSGDKPFVMGKYDGIRMAASVAEGFATGGLGMGRYMRFEDPVGFEVLSRYLNFRYRQSDLFDNATRMADAALVLPRQTVLNRRPESLDVFRSLGQQLVERQAVIDVVADQRLTAERLARYPAVILPGVLSLSDEQLAMLREFAKRGGVVLARGDTGTLDENGKPRSQPGIPGALQISDEAVEAAADNIVKQFRAKGLSAIDSPWTVRVAAYSQPKRVLLHLVNYNRDESPVPRKDSGPASERPIAVEDISVSLRLPENRTATGVSLYSPDDEKPIELTFESRNGHAVFTIPRVLVYGVVSIDTQSK